MKMHYFGDSYDLVKQALLRWLRPFGEWSIHPMFTERWSPADVVRLETLLGAAVISRHKLSLTTNRKRYFASAVRQGHLFLDPNTGVLLSHRRPKNVADYLLADELICLTKRREDALTLVFDQSTRRGHEQVTLLHKLEHFHRTGLFGFAYVSHASFLLLSPSLSLAQRAYKEVLTKSRLPSNRLLTSLNHSTP